MTTIHETPEEIEEVRNLLIDLDRRLDELSETVDATEIAEVRSELIATYGRLDELEAIAAKPKKIHDRTGCSWLVTRWERCESADCPVHVPAQTGRWTELLSAR